MEQRLKILYKDESGNLKLHKGIGICDIYVFNDGEYLHPYFWVISRNRRLIINYPLDKLWFAPELKGIFKVNNKNINLTAKDQYKIYEYITAEKDEDGNIKWINMMNRRTDSRHHHIPQYMINENRFTIYNTTLKKYFYYGVHEGYNLIENFGSRLGKCEIIFSDQFRDSPIISIHSFDTSFYTMISALNGRYYGFDHMTDEEAKLLYDIMKEPHDSEICKWCAGIIDFMQGSLCIKDMQQLYNYFINNISIVPRFDLMNSNDMNIIPDTDEWVYILLTKIKEDIK